MLEYIRFILGAALLLIGIVIFVLEIIGVFKMKYILNRMHAAAMGDSLGILSCMLGLMIISGFNFTTVKMLLIVIFLWCTSPVASHLIAQMEVDTSEDAGKFFEEGTLKEVEESMEEE